MPKAIAQLRLQLASIEGRENEVIATRRQFSRQMKQAPEFALRGNPLDSALTVMSEVQERLDQVNTTPGHLRAIRERAEAELQALELVQKIDRANKKLDSLKRGDDPDQLVDRDEIKELERFVKEASNQAAEAIAGGSAV